MKTNFLILFLLFNLSVTAQLLEPNALKIGLGFTRHSLEKINTPSLSIIYTKDFFPKSLIELNATALLPVDINTEEETRKLKSYQFGMNMLFKILETRKQTFNAGFGFSSGYYGTNSTNLISGVSEEKTEFSPGFSAVVAYDYILPSQWAIGFRTSFSRYNMDRGSWTLCGVAGYRF